jgi:hypothetical protein
MRKALESGMNDASVRLGGLRDELTQLIEDDDERWYAFGFDKPNDPDTPAVPEHVVITFGALGTKIFIDWGAARRATSYRVTATDKAHDPPVVLEEKIVTESEATLTTIPSGTQFNVTVTSRNSKGGESAPSDPPASGTVT